MSMTKNQNWDEICRRMWEDSREEEYFASMEQQDETEIDWFPDYRLAHDGFSEIGLDFATEFFAADLADDEIPF